MNNQEVLALLDAMETELRCLNVWETCPPSSEALSSTTPFCIDTLQMSQWLQWVFMPRIRAIVEAGGVLPSGANMKPYAQEALPVDKIESEQLILLIERFDRLMQ
ncbi:hypothetical protein CI610_01170 [invertebrate metagenome]|uniref:YqcC-like domain-containing protein n=1 Tax=invertebrate metagenome TaxID=1711999 RepID=A0A2H9T9I6_9ZZZZ